MYTRYRTEAARLRAYHRELTDRYHDAMRRRDWAGARRLYDRRQRVWATLLWYAEWDGHPPARPSGQPARTPVASPG